METSPTDINAMLNDQTVLANIRRYIDEGGKRYITDGSGEIVDRAFPHQLALGDDGADRDGTYDPATFFGTLTKTGDADGGLYEANTVQIGVERRACRSTTRRRPGSRAI